MSGASHEVFAVESEAQMFDRIAGHGERGVSAKVENQGASDLAVEERKGTGRWVKRILE